MPTPFHALLGLRSAVCWTETLWASYPDDGQTQAASQKNRQDSTHCVQHIRVQEGPQIHSTLSSRALRLLCVNHLLACKVGAKPGAKPGAREWMDELDSWSMVSSALGRRSLESWTWAQSNHELSPAKEPKRLVTGFSNGMKYAYIRLPLLVHISVNFPLMHL